MVQWMRIVLIVVVLLIGIGGIFSYIRFSNENRSLSIIGGADGPTTIFLSGQLGNENTQIAIEETQETKDERTQSINENNESNNKKATD